MEQQRFVELSNNLIDQALTRSGLSQSMDVVLQGRDEQAPELDADERKRLYALVQRLPSGDWWSSATIPRGGSVGITRAEASALSTKQAELAMVVPSLPLLPSEVPTLGTLKPPVLKPAKDPGWQATYLPQRKLHAPKLLEWGPYMTFAPSYDTTDCELGPGAAFQTTYESIVRRKARAARKQLEEKMRRNEEAERKDHMPAVDSGDVEMSVGLNSTEDDHMDLTVQAKAEEGELEHVISNTGEEGTGKHFSAHEAVRQLHGLFSPDEAEALKEAFQQLEIELGVSELLRYIAISLQSLVDMQRERLGAGVELEPDGLEHQTGEWMISNDYTTFPLTFFLPAQEATKSLALLLSMRPRTYEQPNKSLVPPPAILRTLHRSIPALPITSWRGILAGNRPTALRDDTTVTIKTTARAQAAAQAASQLYSPSTASQPVSTPPSYPNGTPAVPNFGRGGPMPSPMTPGPFVGPYGNYYPNYYSGYPSPGPTPGPYGGARPIPDMTKSQGQGQSTIPKGWQGYHHGAMPPTPSASAIPPHMTGVFRPGVPPPSANKSFYR